MTSINDIQDEIIDDFNGLDDWMDRYAYIIELGNAVPTIDEKYKTQSNLIEGCQSRVWLTAAIDNGVITFRADSDAIIVKGIISLLIRVLSAHTPQEILNSDLYFIQKIGLQDHLSPTRSNGLLAMVKQMRMYALAFNAKQELDNK
ncbi:MAG: SufE family protein [Muribaculaceae bacterium]